MIIPSYLSFTHSYEYTGRCLISLSFFYSPTDYTIQKQNEKLKFSDTGLVELSD